MDYRIINIRTVRNEGTEASGLSFVESEHDIPFPINKMYFIYESEQKMQKGYYPHEQSWHLLFCPNGEIDVTIDNGIERTVIPLDDPSKGLILHSDLWREIVWAKKESVLCVAAPDDYEAHKYRRDYDSYLRLVQEKKLTLGEPEEYIGGPGS